MSTYIIESDGPQLHFIPDEEFTHMMRLCFCEPEIYSVGGLAIRVHKDKYMRAILGIEDAKWIDKRTPEQKAQDVESMVCNWDFRGAEFTGAANSGCGKIGVPYESDMLYCPYCGKPIKLPARA